MDTVRAVRDPLEVDGPRRRAVPDLDGGSAQVDVAPVWRVVLVAPVGEPQEGEVQTRVRSRDVGLDILTLLRAGSLSGRRGEGPVQRDTLVGLSPEVGPIVGPLQTTNDLRKVGDKELSPNVDGEVDMDAVGGRAVDVKVVVGTVYTKVFGSLGLSRDRVNDADVGQVRAGLSRERVTTHRGNVGPPET